MHYWVWTIVLMQQWGSPGVRTRTVFISICTRDLKANTCEIIQAAKGFHLSPANRWPAAPACAFKRDTAKSSLATLAPKGKDLAWHDEFSSFLEFSEIQRRWQEVWIQRDTHHPSPNKMKLLIKVRWQCSRFFFKNTKMLPNVPRPWLEHLSYTLYSKDVMEKNYRCIEGLPLGN